MIKTKVRKASNNNTEIIFLIDKSGSMSNLVDDTIGGFNNFIKEQKTHDYKTTLTTVLFDSSYRTIHDGIDINKVNYMTKEDYIPSGMTAMLDAIGDTIENVQERHDSLGNEKPSNVLFVITTDGQENSSRKFSKSKIEKMIKHQTVGHGWKFMFLGANMDAVSEASSIGISKDYSINYNYDSWGTRAVYDTVLTMADAMATNTTENINLNSAYASCYNENKNASNVN